MSLTLDNVGFDNLSLIFEYLLYPLSDKKDAFDADEDMFLQSLQNYLSLQRVCRDWRQISSSSININFRCGWPLGKAIECSQVSVLHLLDDPRLQPSINDNYALVTCVMTSKLSTLELLLRDSRIELPERMLEWVLTSRDARVLELFLKDGRMQLHPGALMKCALEGLVEMLKLLLADDRIDVSYNRYTAFLRSIRGGQVEVVRAFLSCSRLDPSALKNSAIGLAAASGHTDIVRMLMEDDRVDPSANNCSAIRRAASSNRTEVFELLLPVTPIDLSEDDNFMLRYASQNGHTSMVQVLLKHPEVDPSARDNFALRFAANKNIRNAIIECKKSRGTLCEADLLIPTLTPN
ncbi:ankyrin repeat domain-containing protein 44 [Planoprotostelium fungivorum]|uniref:Ankyrin repeat domain-containing protein 44 n=1 Tax=Planoprotostelium fungivorum TaxID=1890364 RepID=A0A2P6MXI0_9EUKA|nr:ankyrin repeat domain-containing protein 44 [Planoprotostelium fungivorum]